MKPVRIVDTGPLVAFLIQRDPYHEWARDLFLETRPPLLTCEAVISEACFLLRSTHRGSGTLMEMLRRGAVSIAFSSADHLERLDELMRQYANVPMSFADACLVRMFEIDAGTEIATLDGDFGIYRILQRKAIRRITPPR